MEFIKALENCQFNCLEHSQEDYVSSFGRRTKFDYLRNVDFRSKTELDQMPDDLTSQFLVCGFRSVSTTKYIDENHEDFIKVMKAVGPLTPKWKPYICFYKLKVGAGKVVHTPTNNTQHYSLFKADDFDCESHTELIQNFYIAEEQE
jgi:hypothetical protein